MPNSFAHVHVSAARQRSHFWADVAASFAAKAEHLLLTKKSKISAPVSVSV